MIPKETPEETPKETSTLLQVVQVQNTPHWDSPRTLRGLSASFRDRWKLQGQGWALKN